MQKHDFKRREGSNNIPQFSLPPVTHVLQGHFAATNTILFAVVPTRGTVPLPDASSCVSYVCFVCLSISVFCPSLCFFPDLVSAPCSFLSVFACCASSSYSSFLVDFQILASSSEPSSFLLGAFSSDALTPLLFGVRFSLPLCAAPLRLWEPLLARGGRKKRKHNIAFVVSWPRRVLISMPCVHVPQRYSQCAFPIWQCHPIRTRSLAVFRSLGACELVVTFREQLLDDP